MKGYKKVVFTEGLISRINDILTEVDKIQSIIDKETFIREVETQGWFGKKKIHREYWNITEFHNLLMKHVFKGSIIHKCFNIKLVRISGVCDMVYGIVKADFYIRLKTLQTLSNTIHSDNEALIDDVLYSVLLEVLPVVNP